MGELVTYTLENKVAAVKLHNGKVNVMSPQMLAAINGALDQAEQDDAVVMLIGQPGIFSAGFDLNLFKSDPAKALEMIVAGSTLCRRLLAFPLPVVAVCTGHSIAQGCFTLLACDYRIGVEGPYKIGLNESKIGMTMHHVGIELSRNRLAPAFFNRAVMNAEMFDPQLAVTAGFFDQSAPEESLMACARAEAERLSGLDLPTFKATKRKAHQALLATMDEAITLDMVDQRQMLFGEPLAA